MPRGGWLREVRRGGRAAVCGAPAGRVPNFGAFSSSPYTPCLCAGFGGPASRHCGAVIGWLDV